MTNKNATNENATDYLYLIFDIIDRETKELLLYSIFIITRRYKRVEIRVMVEELWKSCCLTRNIEISYKGRP